MTCNSLYFWLQQFVRNDATSKYIDTTHDLQHHLRHSIFGRYTKLDAHKIFIRISECLNCNHYFDRWIKSDTIIVGIGSIVFCEC